MLSRVCDRLIDQAIEFGHKPFRGRIDSAYPPQYLFSQVIAAHVIEDGHVERRCRRALLDEAPHVETLGMNAPVDDFMNCPLVAVEGENDRFVGCEELDKACLGHAVRMDLLREQRHQIHDIDETNLEVRQADPMSQSAAPRASSVGTSPAQAITTSGSCPSSLLAQRQIEAPAAQWSIASAMGRYCKWGCLSATIRLT